MDMWNTESVIFHGWALAEQGQVAQGIAQMRRAMAAFRAMGNAFILPFFGSLLAEQYIKIGRLERALTLVSQALATVERTGERWCEAELYRCRGVILLKSGDHSGAKIALLRALDIARYQQAKAFELRAATSLARLHLLEARHAEARDLLESICAWFGDDQQSTEAGEARALLDGLAAWMD
jgi:predicted ATPase